MATEYAWEPRRGSRVPATIVGQTIERIGGKNGSCPPERLIAAAEPADSPLHPLFEWDDETAAHHWRVKQARGWIAGLRIVTDGKPKPEPAFVHVQRITPAGVTDGYMRTDRALRTTDYRTFILQDAMRQLTGLRNRFRHLEELSKVWSAVEETETEVTQAA